jgi:hypothetical protein
MSEVNGTIYVRNGQTKKGQGRIAVQIFDSRNKKVAETVSESDGYYSYLGLKSGTYRIQLEDKQLGKGKYQAQPKEQQFTVYASEEGTIADRLDFTLEVKEIVQDRPLEATKSDVLIKDQKSIEHRIVKPIKDGLNKVIFSSFIDFEAYQVNAIQKEWRDLNNYDEVEKQYPQYYYGFFNKKENVFLANKREFVKDLFGTSIDSHSFRKENSRFKTKFQNGKELEWGTSLIKTDTQIYCSLNTSFNKIEEEAGLFYSVQIGVFNNYIPSKYLLNFEPIFYQCMADGSIKYISGKYISKKQAKIARNKIIKKGIEDAYIVQYNNGKKINTAVTTE